jgi:hypothetical protein
MTTQLLFSLDYELFFGRSSGTIENSVLVPTEAAREVPERHGAKLILFVDAGMLVRLRAEARKFPSLNRDLAAVCAQLERLSGSGHDIQLHIHPHWEDSSFDGERWQMSTKRYKLHDFPPEEITRIVSEYKAELAQISGQEVFAYRAGGWCVQPFAQIADGLAEAGVWLDSSVIVDGKSLDSVDFSGAPRKSHWRFGSDPVIEDKDGRFVEIPISSVRVAPTFFWHLAWTKLVTSKRHKQFGDGSSLSRSGAEKLRMMTRSSHSVASVDGLKAGLLPRALRQLNGQPDPSVFNIMGHPKSLTRYSLERIDRFFREHSRSLEPRTFRDFAHLKPA